MAVAESTDMEDVSDFRERAKSWLEQTFPAGSDVVGDRIKDAGGDPKDRIARNRMMMRILSEGGFSGIVYPREYGGAGLTTAHYAAFNQEIHQTPAAGEYVAAAGNFGMTLGMIAPTLLEFASEELKQRHIRAMLCGDELWVQFLSEPTGGSDMAGSLTRATRDGDTYVISGSKVWTSSADFSDVGFMLARTNWGVPKHRGLSMFVVPIHTTGLTVQPLRLVTGNTGFCQEFFDDVTIPATNLVGNENDGWTVASRLLVHERNSVGGGSEFHNASLGITSRGGAGARRSQAAGSQVASLARRNGLSGDAHVRQLMAEAHVLNTVNGQLGPRIAQATRKGALPPPAGSLLKLFGSTTGVRVSDITMELAGSSAVVWPARTDDESESEAAIFGGGASPGVAYLFRQAGSILSGTSEIQRNIISERVLGLPREPAPDRDLPFSEVRHNSMPQNLDRSRT